MNIETLERKIKSSKQVGFSHWKKINDVNCYESVGLQKWKQLYKVYIGRISEHKMAEEEFEIDEITEFDTLSEAIKYIEEFGANKFEQMKPCKGQRIFNASFEANT